MKLGSCPQCGGTLQKLKGIATFESLPNVALHDSDVKCINSQCDYTIDLAADRYLVRVAALVTRLQSQVVFLPQELIWSVDFLAICAGHEEKFVQYIGFDNFLILQKLKINLKEGLWPIDFDTACCINPFYREAQDRVVKKLGYPNRDLFHSEISEAVRINKQMDGEIRRMIGQIDVPKKPRGMVKIDGKQGMIIHLYY